jgi:hypothetical protein
MGTARVHNTIETPNGPSSPNLTHPWDSPIPRCSPYGAILVVFGPETPSEHMPAAIFGPYDLLNFNGKLTAGATTDHLRKII